MHTILWILSFVGVALIYFLPYIGGKLGWSANTNASLKLSGVILAIICLIALYRTGGFN